MTEETGKIRFRRAVDALGFGMIYHVLTLDRELSDGAFRLYALLVMYARQSGGCWPGIERLAADLDVSQPTVKRRIAELVDRGLVTRDRRYGRSSVTWLEDLEPLYYDRLKNELFEQPFDQLKNDTTEEQAEKKKQDAAAVLSEQQQQALDLLLTVPRMDGATARQLVRTCDLAEVAGWVAEGLRAKVDNPAALVVARLRAGEPAPPVGGSTEESGDYWRRMVEGKYKDLIQT